MSFFLSVEDPKLPHSLPYHVADIFLTEIERLSSSTLESATDSESSSPAPVSRSIPVAPLLGPFYASLAVCPTTTMFTRFTDEVFTPLLDAALPPAPQPPAKRRKGAPKPRRPEYPATLALAVEGEGAKGEEAAGEKLGKAVLKRLFEEGGKAETSDVNRRRIYAFVSARDVDLE